MISTEIRYSSFLNNNQQEKDFDTKRSIKKWRRVTFSLKKQFFAFDLFQGFTTFDRTLGRNDVNSILNKSPMKHPGDISFGRGRGREQINTAPSFSKESLSSSLNNPSSQRVLNTFSRRLASNFSPSNDQSSSIGSISTNERKFSFSKRLQSTTNKQFSHPVKAKSTDTSSISTPDIMSNDTNYISDQFSPHIKSKSRNSSDSFSKSFLPTMEQKQNNQNENHCNNYTSANDGRLLIGNFHCQNLYLK